MTFYDIGTGIADVTDPAIGLYMAGMSDPRQITMDVESKLYARAFIVVDLESKKRVVIVSADIWTATQVIKTEVIKKLNESNVKKIKNKYSDDNVLISGTHTHSGPAGYSHNKLYDPSSEGLWTKIGQFFDNRSTGYNAHTFDCIVSGIVKAIENAHENLKPGKIYINTGLITEDCGNQRSVDAFENNKEFKADSKVSQTDKEMLLLKFVRLDEVGNPTLPIGTINWYPIHPTDRGQFNRLVSGDNKGEASRLFEEEMGTDYLVTDTFVAAFANSNCGDVSGNVKNINGKLIASVPNPITANIPTILVEGDPRKLITIDKANMIAHGQAQYKKAKDLFFSATRDPVSKERNEISGSVDYRHTRIDMANIDLGGNKRTYPAALGASFAAGSSEDSVPEPSAGLKEGITTEEITKPQNQKLKDDADFARDILKINFGLKKAAQVSTDWGGTKAMTAMNGLLYIVHGDTLWEKNPKTNAPARKIETGWGGTEAMTAMNGLLYIVQGEFFQGGILWEKDPNKAAQKIETGWGGTQAMTSMNGRLYIVRGGILWEKDPNKAARNVSTGWGSTEAMTSMNGLLYIVQGELFQGGILWEKDPNKAARKIETGWGGTGAMASTNGLLYIVWGGALWEKDPTDRKKNWKISEGWGGIQAMTALNGHLYLVQENTLWDHFEQGHWPKPIILNLVAAELPLVPNILPIQILKIGSLVITGVPGELTTMAGRRLKKTVLDELKGFGVDDLALATYANDYSQYITTKEEYDMQHYEGASTLFGPYTLEAYQQEFKKLAKALRNPTIVLTVPGYQGPSSDANRRVTIRNDSNETLNIKLYKANVLLNSITLPNGDITLKAKTEIAYFLPGDVERAAVYVNGGLRGAVQVGHLFRYPPAIQNIVITGYYPPAPPQIKSSTIKQENNPFYQNEWLQPVLHMMSS